LSTAPHRLGKYEFQEFLGKGNVGEVWKARNLSNRRDVALKTVYADLQRSDPQFLTRFVTDGQVLVALRHANLVPILEVNVKREEQSNEIIAYLAMEYVAGQTFASYIQNTSHQSNFPALSVISVFFKSLGLALDYAYQREIVHGNLTPANILLNQQDTTHFPAGEPLLTDIGLAQILASATNISIKSPLYLSPEQAQGYPPSQRSDVYTLGIILYEIYTGTVPFRGENSTSILSQHIRTLPTPPALINPVVPPVLSEVILRAIAKDPTARFPDVSTFAAAIADASATQSSFSIKEQSPRKDITTASQLPQPRNSLLGVAQPPSLPGLPPSSYPGRPSLSGLIPKERLAPMPALPSTPPPSPSQSQPMMTKPLPSEANQVAQSPQPEPPTVQARSAATVPPLGQAQTQMPEPVEPKNLDTHTQAISLSAILQAEQASQTHTPPNVSPSDRPAFNADYPTFASVPPQQIPPTPQSLQAPLYEREQRPPTPVMPTPQQRKKTSLYIAIAALLALVIIGGILGTSFYKGSTANPAAPGNRAFLQDGTLHNDQLRINMQNIAPPPDGQTYFAWLKDPAQHTQPLGALSLQNGNISFLYQGDAKHTNLMAIMQGVLITTEEVGKTPEVPSNHKVYQASFDPQLLDGLKYLLYATPGLPDQKSVIATIEDTLQSIDDKAGSIVDTLHHDNALAMRQATRIIEMLDNSQQAKSSGDLPAKYPLQLDVPIGLLSSPSQQGYLDILDTQLKQLEPLVVHNPDAQQHLNNIKSALGDLKEWLQKMHDLDVQLLKAVDLQDPGISGIALQLKRVSADSFTGHTIAPNPSPQPTPGSAGAKQAYSEAQYMATLSLQPV
jgi:serine/threonine protein kinase